MKRICSIILILSLTAAGTYAGVSSNVSAEQVFYPLHQDDKVIINALNYLKNQQNQNGCIGSVSVSAWAAIAASSAGENLEEWGKLVEYLKNSVNRIDTNKATDWERQTLAIVACNENPRDFGGINYVAKIKGFYDGTQMGDPSNIYDDVFGVLSLVSAGENKNSTIIQTLKTYIEGKQNDNGGWGDVDTTAAAVMALIAADENKNSYAVKNALLFIKSMQTLNGGFQSWGQTNAASTAWAVMAIVAAGQNPLDTNWQIHGASPVDFLLDLQQENGGFMWSIDKNMNPEWMTSYVVPALLGKPLPVKIYQISRNNGSNNETTDNNETINDAKVSDSNSTAIEIWTGNIRIEGKNHTIWSGTVSLSSSIITALNDSSGEMENYSIPYPSVLGALDETSHQGGFSYSVVYYPSWDAFYVKTIAGESNWWHYLVDYNVPMVDAGRYRLTSDDKEILWGYLENWYVHVLRINVDKTVVNQSEEFTVTVYNESMTPVENATIHVGSMEYTSNKSGEATVRINNPGEYIVYAEKNGFVRSDKTKVHVGKMVEIVKPMRNAVYLWNKKMGLKTHKTFVVGAVNVEVKASDDITRVEFYVDDKLEYTDDEKPFEWKLNKFAFIKKMTIEVKGYTGDACEIQRIIDRIDALSGMYGSTLFCLIKNHLMEMKQSSTSQTYTDTVKVVVINFFPFLHG